MPITAERMLTLCNSAEAVLNALIAAHEEAGIVAEGLLTGAIPTQAAAQALANFARFMPPPDILAPIFEEGHHFSKGLKGLQGQRRRQAHYSQRLREAKVLKEHENMKVFDTLGQERQERSSMTLEELKADIKPRVEAWLAERGASAEAKARQAMKEEQAGASTGQAAALEPRPTLGGDPAPPAITGEIKRGEPLF